MMGGRRNDIRDYKEKLAGILLVTVASVLMTFADRLLEQENILLEDKTGK